MVDVSLKKEKMQEILDWLNDLWSKEAGNTLSWEEFKEEYGIEELE